VSSILESRHDSGIDDIVPIENSKELKDVQARKIIRLQRSNGLEVKSGLNSVSKKDKVLECGALESRFPCSESKILDFLIAFQAYDYSISDIAKNSGVGFKTTLGVIKELETREVILKERNVGRAKMYKLNLDSKEAVTLKKLALDIAITNAKSNNS